MILMNHLIINQRSACAQNSFKLKASLDNKDWPKQALQTLVFL